VQANLKFFVLSERPIFQGWKYFWAKNVKGFNPDVHCARCLVGSYIKPISTRAQVNAEIELSGHGVGDLIYVCGVAQPYKWANNFHMACRVTGSMQDVAAGAMAGGDTFMMRGAVRVDFDAETAQRQFAGRGRDFLTCRNFQFGAQFASQFACT
jgi:hypothetical protein